MSNESELRKRRVCFTGHRPEKLNKSEVEIVALLEREIRAAITDGFQTFISGMARGVDIWAAEVVLRLRDNGAPQYDRGCFQRRNEWMVDHAGRVIAVFNGEKGGTKNTIDYAERQNVPVIYIP